MSHVETIKIKVRDLDALGTAAERLGMEMRKQSNYRWFGSHVGDYPLPEGFTASDLGKCEYALSIPDSPNAYEVGVAPSPDGDGYTLLWDFWSGGYGLQAQVGQNGSRLIQEYARAIVEQQVGNEWSMTDQMTEDGSLVLTLEGGSW